MVSILLKTVKEGPFKTKDTFGGRVYGHRHSPIRLICILIVYLRRELPRIRNYQELQDKITSVYYSRNIIAQEVKFYSFLRCSIVALS